MDRKIFGTVVEYFYALRNRCFMYKCSLFCSFYKGEKFIEGYIKNLLQLNMFEDIQFVFLNCDSPENEESHILPLLNKYNNIKYKKLEFDPGLYAGWNLAIKMCDADIIGNWNIDDRKNKESIEIMYEELANDINLDMVYGYNYMTYVANETYDENKKDKIFPCYQHSTDNLLRHNSPHCMPMWKKKIHDRQDVGYFNESLLSCSDAELWLKLDLTGGFIKMINKPTGLYYNNPQGRSTNKENIRIIIKEYYDMRNRVINKYMFF